MERVAAGSMIYLKQCDKSKIFVNETLEEIVELLNKIE